MIDLPMRQAKADLLLLSLRAAPGFALGGAAVGFGLACLPLGLHVIVIVSIMYYHVHS